MATLILLILLTLSVYGFITACFGAYQELCNQRKLKLHRLTKLYRIHHELIQHNPTDIIRFNGFPSDMHLRRDLPVQVNYALMACEQAIERLRGYEI